MEYFDFDDELVFDDETLRELEVLVQDTGLIFEESPSEMVLNEQVEQEVVEEVASPIESDMSEEEELTAITLISSDSIVRKFSLQSVESSVSESSKTLENIPIPPTPIDDAPFEAQMTKIFSSRDSLDFSWMRSSITLTSPIDTEVTEEVQPVHVDATSPTDSPVADSMIPLISESLKPFLTAADRSSASDVDDVLNSEGRIPSTASSFSKPKVEELMKPTESSNVSIAANPSSISNVEAPVPSDSEVELGSDKNPTDFVKLVRNLSKKREQKLALQKVAEPTPSKTVVETIVVVPSSSSNSAPRKLALPRVKPEPLNTDIDSLMDIYNPSSSTAQTPNTAQTIISTPTTPRTQRFPRTKFTATAPSPIRSPQFKTNPKMFSVLALYSPTSSTASVPKKKQDTVVEESAIADLIETDSMRLSTLLQDFYPTPSNEKSPTTKLNIFSEIKKQDFKDSRLTLLLSEYSPSLPTPASQFKTISESIPSPLPAQSNIADLVITPLPAKSKAPIPEQSPVPAQSKNADLLLLYTPMSEESIKRVVQKAEKSGGKMKNITKLPPRKSSVGR